MQSDFYSLEYASSNLEREINTLFESSLDNLHDPSILTPLESKVRDLEKQVKGNLLLEHQRKSLYGRIKSMDDNLVQIGLIIANCPNGMKISYPIPPYPKLSEALLRETLYTAILEIFFEDKWLQLDQENLSEQEFYTAICSLALLKILENSEKSNGICLLENKVLNEKNCLEGDFKHLFCTMMEIKKGLNHLSKDQLNQIESSCVLHSFQNIPDRVRLANGIHSVAKEITKKELFKHLIKEVIDISGITAIKYFKIRTEEPIAEDLIRETFYNAIPVALESIADLKLITEDQILDQDAFIFPAISSLALLKVIEFSKGSSKSLKLMKGKEIRENNCPPIFKDSLMKILLIKEQIDKLDKAQMILLWSACVANPTIEMPYSKDRNEIMGLASILNSISNQVNQIDNFKKNAPQVLEIIKTFVTSSKPY